METSFNEPASPALWVATLHRTSLAPRHTSTRMSVKGGALWLSAAALSCGSVTAPIPLPDGARQFVPEAVFADWWREMELCSGQTAEYAAVKWYAVPGEDPFTVSTHRGPVVGYWDPGSNRIVVLQYLPNRRAPVIRHEALHAIIRRVDHPKEYFEVRCGAVINGPESPFQSLD